MDGLAQLAEFAVTSWLLWRLVDRCYFGRVPADAGEIEDLPPGPAEPGLRLREGTPPPA